MKARLHAHLGTIAWSLMAALAILTGVKSMEFVTTDTAAFDPLFRDNYAAHLPLILAHGVFAIPVLMMGPFLFLAEMRRPRMRPVHRWLGRLYLLGVVGGGTTGFAMGMMAFGGPAARTAFCLVAAGWLATGVAAYRAARARRFADHRAWMIRNYALTFGAVMLRMELDLAQRIGLDYVAVYPVIAWLAWAPNLFVAQWIIVRGIARTAPLGAKPRPADRLAET